MRFLIAFLCIFTTAFADPLNSKLPPAQESDPLLLVENCVHALTGEYVIQNQDLYVEGIEPISLYRTYVSGDGRGDLGGFAFTPHTLLILKGEKQKKKNYVYNTVVATEPNGISFTYKCESNRNFLLQIPQGLVNTASDEIGAGSFRKNQTLKRINNLTFVMTMPSGMKRIYRKTYVIDHDVFFLLQQEQLPNGNIRSYSYDFYRRLSSIKTTNPSQDITYAWCKFTYADSPNKSCDFTITTSDNQKIAYHFSKGKTPILQKIKGDIEEQFVYTQGDSSFKTRIKKHTFSNGSFNHIYYLPSGKVQKLLTNQGKTISFSYSQNQTEVQRGDGTKTQYVFSSSNRPEKIVSFAKGGEPLHEITMKWTSEGLLTEKIFFDSENVTVGKHSYQYDKRGNVLEESFSGDLTGNYIWESYRICKEFDPLDRVTYIKETSGKTSSFSYLGETTFPLSITIGNDEKTWMDISYEYDENHILQHTFVGNEEVYKDWTIPKANFDTVFAENSQILAYNARGQVTQFIGPDGSKSFVKYQLDGTLQSVESETIQILYHRDLFGRLLHKQILSHEGEILKEEKWQYSLLHLISYVDPAGLLTTYSYDKWGRKIKETMQTEKGLLDTLFFYDEKNRLEKKQTGDLVTIFEYDEYDRIFQIKEEDHLGNLLGISPYSPKEKSTLPLQFAKANQSGVHEIFDSLGRLIELYTDDGTIHYTLEYNSRDQPTKLIDHIQKTEGTLIYDIQGNLRQETLLNGQTLKSAFDLFGRRIQYTLPDNSTIFYRWGPKYLKEIRRKTIKDQFDYRHLFSKYDLGGFPIEQRLASGFGLLSFVLDGAMQITSITSQFLEQSGAISLKEKTADSSLEKPSFTYVCDGLGRITEFHFSDKKIYYTYDIWNRRLSKTVIENIRGDWKETSQLAYLYDEQKEIGAMDLEDYWLRQLRVCAKTKVNAGDQAISYELEGFPYIPLHDLKGNPHQLISFMRQKIMEIYCFTESGIETLYDIWGDQISFSKARNPWRFGCHRIDEETGLLFINGKYYDPESGFID